MGGFVSMEFVNAGRDSWGLIVRPWNMSLIKQTILSI